MDKRMLNSADDDDCQNSSDEAIGSTTQVGSAAGAKKKRKVAGTKFKICTADASHVIPLLEKLIG